jgi:hypothetical protein
MSLTFKVGEVPYTKPFQFADLAELMILVQLSGQVSKADLDTLINTGSLDSDPDGDGEELDQLGAQQVHDRSSEDCFLQLDYRQGALDCAYPFNLDDALLTARANITDAGYIYLFLLICSRLGSFSGEPGFHQDCAKTFTEVSAVALRASLNRSAEVYVFDAGSDDRAEYFHTDLRHALRRLATMMNASPIEDLIEQQSSSGDGGLDLIAINRLGDTAKGVLAYFAQCAAQMTGWPKKTLEAKRTTSFFSMGHEASNLLYTPVMYRKSTGRWVNDLFSHDCIIMDRVRILRALQEQAVEMPSNLLQKMRAVVNNVATVEVA